MTGDANKVGIVAINMTDIHAIRTVATEAGLFCKSAIEFHRWDPTRQKLDPEIEAWIVNLDFEDLENRFPEKIDALMDVPGQLILCDGDSPPTMADTEYPGWRRRLLDTLQDIAGTIKLAQNEGGLPDKVWVLAGSIGGPDAIRKFFAALPPDLGIAFVYANHLEKAFQTGLAKSVDKDAAHYTAQVATHGDVLKPNTVMVVSPEHVTSVKPNGTLNVSREPWHGQYQPNLDHVIGSVAKHFGHTGGVIIFSGMCDDGAAGGRIMKGYGGQVWVQQPDTCVSSAMPDAALATGCVDKVATPEELAASLAVYVKQDNTKAVV